MGKLLLGLTLAAFITGADATRLSEPSGPTSTSAPTSAGPSASATTTPAPATAAPITSAGQLVAAADAAPPPIGEGRLLTYRVEVETDLPVTAEQFAATVDQTLRHLQGWPAVEPVQLQRVTGDAEVTITLASPATTDQLCRPAVTEGRYSCFNQGRAVINAQRWLQGAVTYNDLADYRAYVINHEFGHGLGEPHRRCPSPGAPAPVMVQQTISLEGCTANPWPGVSA